MVEALPLLEQALERALAQLGREHAITLGAMNSLALAYLDRVYTDFFNLGALNGLGEAGRYGQNQKRCRFRYVEPICPDALKSIKPSQDHVDIPLLVNSTTV